HHRRIGQKRRTQPDPRSLCKTLRFPMRLLHAGNGAGELRAASRSSRSKRGRDPKRIGGEPLYVYRLRADRGGGKGCGKRTNPKFEILNSKQCSNAQSYKFKTWSVLEFRF